MSDYLANGVEPEAASELKFVTPVLGQLNASGINTGSTQQNHNAIFIMGSQL